MTTQQLLQIVKDRGLTIALKDGRPVLERAKGNANVNDALLAVLKWHRERIIEVLSRKSM